MTVDIDQPVDPMFVQRLITFMMNQGWLYTGGGINRTTGHHAIRFTEAQEAFGRELPAQPPPPWIREEVSE